MGFSSYIYSIYKPVCNLFSYVASIERKIDSSEAYTRIAQEAIYSDEIDRKPFWGGFSREVMSSIYSPLKKVVSRFEKEGVEEKTVLDLGCGKADSTLYLLQKGWKVLAVDYSQEALDNLQEVANSINPSWISTGQLTLACEDIENYSLPSNVTLIMANRILPYLDPQKIRGVWDRLYDSLAPGGLIVGTLYPRQISSFSELGPRAMMGAWFTDMASVQALLASKSYQIEACDYNNFWFSSLRDIEFVGRKQENPSNKKGLFTIHLSSYFDAVKGLPAKGLFPHFVPFLADRLIELKEMSKLTTFASGAIALTQALFQYDTSFTPYIFAGSVSAWFIFKKFAERMESQAHAHISKARAINYKHSEALRAVKQRIEAIQQHPRIQQLLHPPPPASNPLEALLGFLQGAGVEIEPRALEQIQLLKEE